MIHSRYPREILRQPVEQTRRLIRPLVRLIVAARQRVRVRAEQERDDDKTLKRIVDVEAKVFVGKEMKYPGRVEQGHADLTHRGGGEMLVDVTLVAHVHVHVRVERVQPTSAARVNHFSKIVRLEVDHFQV